MKNKLNKLAKTIILSSLTSLGLSMDDMPSFISLDDNNLDLIKKKKENNIVKKDFTLKLSNRETYFSGHRSHWSHQSHSSHYSHRSHRSSNPK